MRKILAVLLLCLLVCIIVGCKAKKEFIEVEKWQHDTTTIVDTLRITETLIVHDSIYMESQVEKNDSSVTNVQWNYTTYDMLQVLPATPVVFRPAPSLAPPLFFFSSVIIRLP